MTEAEYYAQQLQGLISAGNQNAYIPEPTPTSPQGQWESQFMAGTLPTQKPVQKTNGPIEKTPYEIAAYDSAPPEGPNAWLANKTLAGPGNPMQVRVDAMNRTFNNQGIMASISPNGTMSLSDYVPSPGVGVIPQINTSQGNVAGTVRGIIDQLKKATDIDTARALQAQLNEASATESARIQGEARKFAEQKMGVPELEANLAKMMQLDTASPSYFPGRGDSAVTAQARSQLNAQRAAADIETSRYLKSNVSQNALDAMVKTAGMETARISRLADQQERTTDVMNQRRLAKEEAADMALTEASKGMSEDTKQAIRVLNPVLANGTEQDLAANFLKGRANPAYMAAITAPDADIPKLAAQGNAFSTALLMAKQAAQGIREVDTKDNLRQLQEIMKEGPSPKLKQALASIIPPGPDKTKQVDTAMADMTAKSMGSAADKALASDYKYQVAKQIVAQKLTQNYVTDVANWNSNDPELANAMSKAKVVTGKAGLSEVAVAYIGNTVGPEAATRMDTLIALMEAQAATHKGSLFGMPDTMMLRNLLLREQLKRTVATRRDAMRTEPLYRTGYHD